jgi:sulfonate transport system ATP-binding protein
MLDEPLGSLDALTRLEMQALIESLWRMSGATAILVTHDVDEAIALADRVVQLANGRTINQWPVEFPRPRDRSRSSFSALQQTITASVMDGKAVSWHVASKGA